MAPYALWLAALAPLVVLRDFTPDNELRYLSIADEALREGHLFVFFNHGVAYADKPPLYLWIVMACRRLVGGHCMPLLALCSLLPALGIVGIMERWTAGESDGATRSTIRWTLLTTAFFVGAAAVVRMDMLMAFFIVLSLRTFYRIDRGCAGPAAQWLFPLWLFLALFTKGPFGLLIPVLSIVVYLAFEHRLRDWHRTLGWRTWLVAGGLFLLWIAAAWAEGGNAYIRNLLFHQTLDRAVDAFHHKRPVWYYLTTAAYAMAPWVLYYAFSIARGAARRLIRTPLERFFATVAAVTWVLLSLVSSKLQIYLLPAYPFTAALAALLAAKMPRSRWIAASLAVPAVVLLLALPGLLVVMRFNPMLCNAFLLLAAALLTAGGVASLVHLARGLRTAAVRSLAAAILAALFAGGWALPALNASLGYGQAARCARRVAAERGCTRYAVCTLKNGADIDAYLGCPVCRIPPDSLAAVPRGTLLILSERECTRNAQVQAYLSGRTAVAAGAYRIVAEEVAHR